ncbi:hypothetical protein C0J52_00264 [Blattella germanica]|nr:hypothetical protein C0J52_00264 [Blattella germanica]
MAVLRNGAQEGTDPRPEELGPLLPTSESGPGLDAKQKEQSGGGKEPPGATQGAGGSSMPNPWALLQAGRVWDLMMKRQQYKQGRKPRVTDCPGGDEMTTMLAPLPTLQERFNLSPRARRQTLVQANATASDSVDLDKVNGGVCLLAESPFRILRVSFYIFIH